MTVADIHSPDKKLHQGCIGSIKENTGFIVAQAYRVYWCQGYFLVFTMTGKARHQRTDKIIYILRRSTFLTPFTFHDNVELKVWCAVV